MKKESINNNILICMVIVCALVVVISCTVLHYNTVRSEVIHLKQLETGDVKYCIEYADICKHATSVDSINDSRDNSLWVFNGNGKNNKYLDVQGWAFVSGRDINLFDVDILLKEIGDLSDSYIKMSTEMLESPNLNEYFSEDYNYDCAGFLASIPISKLSENGEYKVYIYYKNDGYNYLVETDTVVSRKNMGGE